MFGPLILLAVVTWIYMDMQTEFFTAWSCETLYDYIQDIDVPDRFPKHTEITEDQHLKLHTILAECQDRFNAPSNHP